MKKNVLAAVLFFLLTSSNVSLVQADEYHIRTAVWIDNVFMRKFSYRAIDQVSQILSGADEYLNNFNLGANFHLHVVQTKENYPPAPAVNLDKFEYHQYTTTYVQEENRKKETAGNRNEMLNLVIHFTAEPFGHANNISGMSTQDSVCRSLGAPLVEMFIREDEINFYDYSVVLAHEIGHYLGMEHDDEDVCVRRHGSYSLGIMSSHTYFLSDNKPWSPCSTSHVDRYIKEGRFSCLQHTPEGASLYKLTGTVSMRDYDEAAQCRHFIQDSESCPAKMRYVTPAEAKQCRLKTPKRYTSLERPVESGEIVTEKVLVASHDQCSVTCWSDEKGVARCPPAMVCYQGRCLQRGYFSLEYQWSSWQYATTQSPNDRRRHKRSRYCAVKYTRTEGAINVRSDKMRMTKVDQMHCKLSGPVRTSWFLLQDLFASPLHMSILATAVLAFAFKNKIFRLLRRMLS